MNTSEVLSNIAKYGFIMQKPVAPVANYVSVKQAGEVLFVSGQLPIEDGKIKYSGQVGSECSEEMAAKAAELCAFNLLTQVYYFLGESFEGLKECVKLEVLVHSASGFANHSKIANGASDLMVATLGEAGKHTRVSIGVSSLPLNAAVEVAAIFSLSK